MALMLHETDNQWTRIQYFLIYTLRKKYWPTFFINKNLHDALIQFAHIFAYIYEIKLVVIS